MQPLAPIPIEDVRAAAERIRGIAIRTPQVELADDSQPSVHLKFENLQPVGSFKVRGAANSMLVLPAEDLAGGIWTASAGNMGRAVAWLASQRGIPCTVVVPNDAPEAKLQPMRELGARIIPEPFDRWWQTLVEMAHPEAHGTFLSPFASGPMVAGNGTIGLEIVEDLPDVGAVVVPFGGGGLSCGIACAMATIAPGVPVYAAEVEGAAPFAAALAAGDPVTIDLRRSSVDGIGSARVTDAMWPLASRIVAGSIVVSLDQVRGALRLIAARGRVVAEGAGAVAVAAALTGRAGPGPVAAVVSGGNIDLPVLAAELQPDGRP